MRERGWFEKEGVRILEGKWQDFVESGDLLSVGGFDVIYTDTFSEDYAGMLLAIAISGNGRVLSSVSIPELHRFFGHIPDLLEGPNSRFSFFNGLGATSTLIYIDSFPPPPPFLTAAQQMRCSMTCTGMSPSSI